MEIEPPEPSSFEENDVTQSTPFRATPTRESGLRVLVLEDVPADAEFTAHALKQAGIKASVTVVDSRPAFVRELGESPPDVILSDFSLPGFGGEEALRIARATAPEVPFIFVTGVLGDDQAVELVKAGAWDYVTKEKLVRLAPAIQRALKAVADSRRQDELLLQAQAASIALHEGDERFRALVQNSMDIIFTMDEEAVISYSSPAIEGILGIDPDDAKGMNILDLVHPDDRDGAVAMLREILRRTYAHVERDIRVRRSDGTYAVIETVARNLMDDHSVRAVVVNARDVTKRIHAEYAAAHFTAIVESSHDAIIAEDLNGLVTSWNRGAERLYGYTEQEMRGRSSARLIPPGSSEDLGDIMERIRSGQQIDDYEAIRVRKDGTGVDVSMMVSPILGADGAMVGVSTIARDISDRRKAEQIKDEFLALVSHELRTPLSSIVAHAELLVDDALPEPRQRWSVEVIDRNSMRLQRLVGDLLFVAQIESGNLPLSMTDVDIVVVARRAVESAKLSAQESGVEVVLEAAEEMFLLTADPGRIGQVLDNLISNAIKHSPGGGAVTVRILRDDDECVIEVEDQGMGIPAEEWEHVFTRFFRASAAVALHIPGVGLGLSIVKMIIEGHGGRVSVFSEPGAGATFRIALPVGQPSER